MDKRYACSSADGRHEWDPPIAQQGNPDPDRAGRKCVTCGESYKDLCTRRTLDYRKERCARDPEFAEHVRLESIKRAKKVHQEKYGKDKEWTEERKRKVREHMEKYGVTKAELKESVARQEKELEQLMGWMEELSKKVDELRAKMRHATGPTAVGILNEEIKRLNARVSQLERNLSWQKSVNNIYLDKLSAHGVEPQPEWFN